jgi:hypothetical protein
MTKEEMNIAADKLNMLQASKNNGNGVRCIQTMITYLRRGQYAFAENVRMLEGDKTRQYADIEVFLYSIFGCRLHGEKDCKDWLCKQESL